VLFLSAANKRFFFWAILCGTIALRLPRLVTHFSGDETNISKAALGLSEIIPELIRTEIYPPVTYFLVHFWMTVSQSEVWIRLYFIIFGIGVCLLVYKIGKDYLGDSFGLIAFLLAGASPMLIWASGYARSYIDSAFFILCSTYFFMKLLTGRGQLPTWISYVFFSLLSIYTSYFSGLILAAHNVYFLAGVRRYRHLIQRWILSQIVVIAFFLPWVPSLLRQMVNIADKGRSPMWDHVGFVVAGVPVGRFVRVLAAGVGLDPYFLASAISGNIGRPEIWIIVILFVAATVLVVFRNTMYFRKEVGIEKLGKFFFPTLFFTILILTLLAWRIFHITPVSRYHVASHAFFLFIMTTFLLSFNRKDIKIALTVGLLLLFSLRYSDVYRPEIEGQKAIAHVLDIVEDKDCIIELGCYEDFAKLNLQYIDLLYYMYQDKKTGMYAFRDEGKAEALKNTLKKYNQAILLVNSMAKPYKAYDLVDTVLIQADFAVKTKRKFHGFEVITYAQS